MKLEAKDIIRNYEKAATAKGARVDLEARLEAAKATAAAKKQAIEPAQSAYVAAVVGGGDELAAKRELTKAIEEAELAALVPRGFVDQIETLRAAEVLADQEAGASHVAACVAAALDRKRRSRDLFRQALLAENEFFALAAAANSEAVRVGLPNAQPCRWEYQLDEIRDLFHDVGVIDPNCIGAWYRIGNEAPVPASREAALRAFDALPVELRDVELPLLALKQGLRVAKRVAREARSVRAVPSADGWNTAPDDEDESPPPAAA